MGFRFRKSVKICKGVKVNFSKSGASLTLGGRGHSVTLGKRSRVTVGIPGTGLSYSTSLSGGSKSSSSRKSTSAKKRSSSTAVPKQVKVVMSPDGKIELRDEKDLPIVDPYVVRTIKSTDTYKAQVQALEINRRQMLDNAYNEAKAENDRFIEIYKQSPRVDNIEQYLSVLNNLRPPVYTRREYDIPYPTENSVRQALDEEAKTCVKGNIFNIGRLRREYVEANLYSRLKSEIDKWNEEKQKFDLEEESRSAAETGKFNEQYIADRNYMNALIEGEDEIINDAVEEWIASCELPVEINVDFEWQREMGVLYLDVDLPEIEDLPTMEVVKLESGNLKEKKKTQATLKQEYVKLVFGLAIFISANLFNISPAIHDIVISGYTQRRDKAGDEKDEYVYSIKFIREYFESSVLENVDPLNFCMRFENRCNITSTMLLKKIEPFETE